MNTRSLGLQGVFGLVTGAAGAEIGQHWAQPSMPRASSECPGNMPLSRRVLDTSVGWRPPSMVSNRPHPTFFIHSDDGMNSSKVIRALRVALAGERIESKIPNELSMYLADAPLMEALMEHPRRTLNADAADWHIANAVPFTSYVLGKFGLLGGVGGHKRRMNNLASSLRNNLHWTEKRQVREPLKPFLILQPYYNMDEVFGTTLLNVIRTRSPEVTVVATVDRSARSVQNGHRSTALFMHALEIPHVATPELADWARACMGVRRSHAGRPHQLHLVLLKPYDESTPRPPLLKDCDAGPRAIRQPRQGFLFHGDTGRFDFGARASIRDVAPHLAAPTSLSTKRLSRGTSDIKLSTTPSVGEDHVLLASPGQVHFKEISRNTSKEMLRTSMCFAPQGDFMSSRRLFDNLAAGCVPVVVKSIGNTRTEYTLGNLPFHHSINWTGIAFFYVPRSVAQIDREQPVTGKRRICRIEVSLGRNLNLMTKASI